MTKKYGRFGGNSIHSIVVTMAGSFIFLINVKFFVKEAAINPKGKQKRDNRD